VWVKREFKQQAKAFHVGHRLHGRRQQVRKNRNNVFGMKHEISAHRLRAPLPRKNFLQPNEKSLSRSVNWCTQMGSNKIDIEPEKKCLCTTHGSSIDRNARLSGILQNKLICEMQLN
jgi:hypothetical protein